MEIDLWLETCLFLLVIMRFTFDLTLSNCWR